MYSRNLFKEQTPTAVPKDYSGTSLKSDDGEDTAPVAENPWQIPQDVPCEKPCTPPKKEECGAKKGGSFLSEMLSSRLGFLKEGSFGSFLGGIGTEEILIIAIALFLLLSRDGDRECAVMLLFLLIF